jgi:hypothetical protein
MVSVIVVKVSDTAEMCGCESFCADIRACSIASPATADVESCVTRTDSWAELGFPFLSTKDRTMSKFVKMSILEGPTNSQMLLAFIRLRMLKFEQVLQFDIDLAKALVPKHAIF